MEYTRELVIKKINQSFFGQSRDKILGILDTYGNKLVEPSKERVQLAILKLSQGNEEKIRKLTELAKIDAPEDVLWPAEEPNLTAVSANMPKMSKEEIQKLQELDRKQYQDWLNE